MSVRHSYPLRIRDHGLGTAVALSIRSLPYALTRFAVEMGFTIAGIVWIVVAFGGAAWLGTHVAQAFGWVWLIVCVGGVGWFWATVLRYVMHLIDCGHVAVLTELVTRGEVGNGNELMFAYGRRIVLAKFGQVNALFALNMVIRGVLRSFHRTLDWIAEAIPLPGLEAISSILNIIMSAATRYLDKAIFSYELARNDDDPWRDAREGLVYYCQNAKPILKTAVWIVIQERVLSFLLWIALMIPAGIITTMLPSSVREAGGLVTVVIAILLTIAVRAAFLKPIFMIMTLVRFHTLIENQAIDEAWDARLAQISGNFAQLGRGTISA